MTSQKGTVKQIQQDCKLVHGFVAKPCEIAEAKELCGHYVEPAWNREGPLRQEIRPVKMPSVIATIKRLGW